MRLIHGALGAYALAGLACIGAGGYMGVEAYSRIIEDRPKYNALIEVNEQIVNDLEDLLDPKTNTDIQSTLIPSMEKLNELAGKKLGPTWVYYCDNNIYEPTSSPGNNILVEYYEEDFSEWRDQTVAILQEEEESQWKRNLNELILAISPVIAIGGGAWMLWQASTTYRRKREEDMVQTD